MNHQETDIVQSIGEIIFYGINSASQKPQITIENLYHFRLCVKRAAVHTNKASNMKFRSYCYYMGCAYCNHGYLFVHVRMFCYNSV